LVETICKPVGIVVSGDENELNELMTCSCGIFTTVTNPGTIEKDWLKPVFGFSTKPLQIVSPAIYSTQVSGRTGVKGEKDEYAKKDVVQKSRPLRYSSWAETVKLINNNDNMDKTLLIENS
jgi:hypothetical protein